MKKIRPPLETDQVNMDKAFQLIMDLMHTNKHIEPSLWAGAVFSVFVNGYQQSGFSYEEFCEELKRVSKHYKCWWQDENGMDKR